MNPKMCGSGFTGLFFLTSLLMSGCNSESSLTEDRSDPVLEEFPVVYIERSLQANFAEQNSEAVSFPITEPSRFNPGARLVLKANATANAIQTDLTAGLFQSTDQNVEQEGDSASTDATNTNQQAPSRIDIRDLSVSPDGQEFLVSIRAPEQPDLDEDQQPRWNIWRYNRADSRLSRLITSDIIAEQGDDLMASFLPDGRIIFASNRQQLSRAILLDEGKPQYQALNERGNQAAFNLHISDSDGTNIRQLTFNLSHDFYPLVLQDGHILYSRWDAMGGDNRINLYKMRPDGTENHLVYGWHSHQLSINQSAPSQSDSSQGDQSQTTTAIVDFIKPQQLPSGDILLLLNSRQPSVYQKRPQVINIRDFTDQNQAIAANNPSTSSALSELFDRQQFDYSFSEQVSPSGRINHLFALPDQSQRYLVSWDLCRVVIDQQVRACGQLSAEQLADPELVQATPFYELWLFNQVNNTQQLVASTSEGNFITEAIVMQASTVAPSFVADKIPGNELDSDLFNQQAGAIHIRSVYDFAGVDSTEQGIEQLKDPSQTSAAQRPARFLRLVRGVPMPPEQVRDLDNTDFGRSRDQLMREILGYTPIQPDGSVKVKVPANIPFALSVVDQNGQRIGGRHRQWLTVRPGEVMQCQGCHTGNSEVAHGRPDAELTSINVGAQSDGVPFNNTNPNLVPSFGQTMAETAEKTLGLAELSSDLSYIDIWTDPARAPLNPSTNLSYQTLATAMPNGASCFTNWTAFCRLQINYLEHIQPLWQQSRLVLDSVTGETLQDQTCTSCHNTLDSDGTAQVPAGQLDLTASPSSDEPAHTNGYRELFFADVEQELVEGILVDRRVPLLDANGNPVFHLGPDGELLLDENGQPIPVLTTVPVNNILSTAGARASARFFEVLNNANHSGALSGDEARLISEWLDIGGQYYNNPFYQEAQ